MGKTRCQRLYQDTLDGFLPLGGFEDYGLQHWFRDPLVWEFQTKREQLHLRRKALLCIMFGWEWDDNRANPAAGMAGRCEEAEWLRGPGVVEHPCIPPTSQRWWRHTVSDWPTIAIIGSGETSSIDYGPGGWVERLHLCPCDDVWDVGFTTDSWP
jgi:hypothetical protein